MLDYLVASSPECFEDELERAELRLPMEAEILTELRKVEQLHSNTSAVLTAAPDQKSEQVVFFKRCRPLNVDQTGYADR